MGSNPLKDSPIAKYAPQLPNEPDAQYQAFLLYLSIPPQNRTLRYMANESPRYAYNSLVAYSSRYKWTQRAMEYDRNMALEQSIKAVETPYYGNFSNAAMRDDVVLQSLEDYAKLRKLWSKALDRLLADDDISSMDLQRIISSRKVIDTMARTAVGLPTSISQSKDGDELRDNDIEGYYINPDGTLQEIRKKDADDK